MIFSGYFINKSPKKIKRPCLNKSELNVFFNKNQERKSGKAYSEYRCQKMRRDITVFFNGHSSEDLERNEDIEGEVRHKVNRSKTGESGLW